MTDIPLKCRCGKVRGVAQDITPKTHTRAVCYCDDCQAFARYLERAEEILDAYGGSDIVQTAQGRITIDQGAEYIRCVRLSEKGMYRWYTACCHTAIGNTFGPAWPFVGLLSEFLDIPDEQRDKVLGPVRGYCFTKSASGALPDSIRKHGLPPSMVLRAFSRIATWKLKGLGKPSPFFNAKGQPVAAPTLADSSAPQQTP